MTSHAMQRGRRAAKSPWLEGLGRAGLAAQGLSYVLVAWLALKLSFHAGGKVTSRQGVFGVLADDNKGRLTLIALALGFAGYAAWRFANAIFDRKDRGEDAPGLAKRAGDLGKGLLYAGLLWSVLEALGKGHASGGGQQKEVHGILGWTGGRWLLLAIALGIFAAAGWNLYRGIFRKFEKQLDECPAWLPPLAIVGLCARGVVFGIIGWFLAKAAIEFDADKAIGLGGALQKLAQAPYGRVVLGIAAAGLLAFGLFCFAQARYREV